MASHRRIARCLVAVAVCTLAFAAGASAASWTRTYVAALPDEAFAVVHVAPDGTTSRHLPHHWPHHWPHHNAEVTEHA